MVEVVKDEIYEDDLGFEAHTSEQNPSAPLLSVRDLVTYFFTEEGIVRAVEGVSFDINTNEVVGLVGETGCGKSVTALSIIQLVRQPGKIMGGNVIFKGEDLVNQNESYMRKIRGKNITMIFQDPMNSLNPVYTVERQLNEVFMLHQKNQLRALQSQDMKDWLKKTPEDFETLENNIVIAEISLIALKNLSKLLKGIILSILLQNESMKLNASQLAATINKNNDAEVINSEEELILGSFNDQKEELKRSLVKLSNEKRELRKNSLERRALLKRLKNDITRARTHQKALEKAIKTPQEVNYNVKKTQVSIPHDLKEQEKEMMKFNDEIARLKNEIAVLRSEKNPDAELKEALRRDKIAFEALKENLYSFNPPRIEFKELQENLKSIDDEIYRLKMESVKLHAEKKNPKRRKLNYYATLQSINALREVKIHTPEKIIKSYPHELSGGMRQRVMIAMGLACIPELLIADEPTTALDVTIQAQILSLMRQLKQKFKTSILIITHDLGTIAEMCDRVAVMYSGRIVEYGNVYTLFKDPKHPYTKGLLNSIPDIKAKVDRLPIIPGTVPNLINPPSGCRFHPRCPYRMFICDKVIPPLYEIDEKYLAACFLFAKTGRINGEVQEDKYPDEIFNTWVDEKQPLKSNIDNK